jgi:hypothetical protein
MYVTARILRVDVAVFVLGFLRICCESCFSGIDCLPIVDWFARPPGLYARNSI